MKNLILENDGATEKLGQKISEIIKSSDKQNIEIHLQGDLGAGKTFITRSIIKSCGWDDLVKSPTYTLCEPYDLADEAQLCHLDLYRLSNPEELEFFGIRDYVASGAILFIEWPSKGEGWLPAPDIQVALQATDTGRQLEISALTADGQDLLNRMGDGHA